MERTTSADGTTIAFERHGDGRPVILLPGALCTRGVLTPLAAALAEGGVPAVTIDRRGRGDSDDRHPGPPWAVEREVEDVAAVLDALGGARAVYGHSSGAALALHVAVSGVDADRLVLHDAPWTPKGSPSDAPAWAAQLAELVGAGRGGDAVAAFMARVGAPAEAVEGMRRGPGWSAFEAVGPTLGYDSAALGDADGAPVPTALLRRVGLTTLVLAGGAGQPFLRDAAREAHAALPDATLVVLDGAAHDAPADVVAPALLPFLDS